MSQPHILIIPPWFDIDYQHHYAKSYHRWAHDLADMEMGKTGLLYGDFSTGIRPKKYYTVPGLNYHYLGSQNWGLPKVSVGWSVWKTRYLDAFRQYVHLYGKPTVIHGFSLLGLIAAETISYWHEIPYTYTEVLGSFISGKASDRLIRKANKPAQQASLVCGISPEMASTLKDTFKVSTKLIPLYVDGKVFYPDSFPEASPRFISIGSPAKTKGLDVLIEAMALIIKSTPDANLTIIDHIPEQSWLESLIRKHQLEDHITFTGAIPHDRIPDFIRKSHVLVSASRIESLGFTMLEALSSGRPVVATDTPGSTYIVQKGRGEIVPQEDPGQLAKAMIQVCQNRSQYNPEELHATIQSQFGKKKILGEWMEIYLRLSNRQRI